MKIELHEITIGEIANGYSDRDEEGVRGFGGLLNIRPQYQREFVYSETKRNAVIDTVRKGFPLNVMYWVKNDDGSFEVLDGQQRTISFCQYVNGDFSFRNKFFHNLTKAEKNKILNYRCMVYFCEGDDLEKLEWFKTINIAGERLTDQELRNAVYTGEWLTDAKQKFSKSNCAAYLLANKYVSGSPIRQDYLETALDWFSGGAIERYMAINQHCHNANELWTYFLNVINWVENTFTVYRREMKGLEWGVYYNTYKDEAFDTKKLENETKQLMSDDDVKNKKGIYLYILSRNKRYLNLRAFTETERRAVYEKQNGICPDCRQPFDIKNMEAHHKIRWADGGHTTIENCVMLCKKCHNKRHGFYD